MSVPINVQLSACYSDGTLRNVSLAFTLCMFHGTQVIRVTLCSDRICLWLNWCSFPAVRRGHATSYIRRSHAMKELFNFFDDVVPRLVDKTCVRSDVEGRHQTVGVLMDTNYRIPADLHRFTYTIAFSKRGIWHIAYNDYLWVEHSCWWSRLRWSHEFWLYSPCLVLFTLSMILSSIWKTR